MATIDDIIASATLREETTTICVAGDLNAEHDRLDTELRQLNDAQWKPGRLSEVDPRRDLAARVADVEARMREHEHQFRFRAMPYSDFKALRKKHTGESGIVDGDAFVPVLVATCCVEPAFTGPDHVLKLFDRLTEGQVDRLFTAAWRANTGAADVPKSVAASVWMASSEQR